MSPSRAAGLCAVHPVWTVRRRSVATVTEPLSATTGVSPHPAASTPAPDAVRRSLLGPGRRTTDAPADEARRTHSVAPAVASTDSPPPGGLAATIV